MAQPGCGEDPIFVAKGSPWENGYVERFNSRFRDELLDRELFLGLADACRVVDRWRLDYNHHRPFTVRWSTKPRRHCCAPAVPPSVRPTASLQNSTRELLTPILLLTLVQRVGDSHGFIMSILRVVGDMAILSLH